MGEIVEKNRERRVTRSKPFTKKMVGRRRVALSEHTGTGIDGKVHRSRTGPDRTGSDRTGLEPAGPESGNFLDLDRNFSGWTEIYIFVLKKLFYLI